MLSPLVSDPVVGPRSARAGGPDGAASFHLHRRSSAGCSGRGDEVDVAWGDRRERADDGRSVRPRHGEGGAPSGYVAREVTAAVKVGESAPGPAVEAGDRSAPRRRRPPPASPHARRSGQGRPHPLREFDGSGTAAAEPVPVPSSILAAEVSRIDAARTSNAVGDYDETIQLIERATTGTSRTARSVPMPTSWRWRRSPRSATTPRRHAGRRCFSRAIQAIRTPLG